VRGLLWAVPGVRGEVGNWRWMPSSYPASGRRDAILGDRKPRHTYELIPAMGLEGVWKAKSQPSSIPYSARSSGDAGDALNNQLRPKQEQYVIATYTRPCT